MSKLEIGARHIGQYPRISPDDQARQRASERLRHIRFVQYVFLGLMTMDEAARALQVGLATLDRHRREFLEDDRQDTDDLRKLDRARKQERYMNSVK